MEERYDSEEVLEDKVDRLVALILVAEHMVAFTGAGISTSAGIGDFRGPQGKWTREAQGLKALPSVSPVEAYPTPTHMSLVQLQQNGILKYLISQNCDGLHRRSGFPAQSISELHGNSNIEICEECGQDYFRSYCTTRIQRARDHFTGRFCQRANCNGRLLNSTIDFGQSLPLTPFAKARHHAKVADLHLAMGSSLTVTPACDQPRKTAENGHPLVIVNLQKTPLTDIAEFQIYAKTDKVMQMVMERLDIPLPGFELRRKVIIGVQAGTRNHQLYCRGADYHDPFVTLDFIKKLKWGNPMYEVLEEEVEVPEQNIITSLPENFLGKIGSKKRFRKPRNVRIVQPVELEFQGHYYEPKLTLQCDFTGVNRGQRIEYIFTLVYNPYTYEWSQTSELSNLLEEPPYEIDNSYGQHHIEYVVDGVWENNPGMFSSREECAQWWAKQIARCKNSSGPVTWG